MRNLLSLVLFVLAVSFFGAIGFAQTDTRASKTWEVAKYDLSVSLPSAETDRFVSARAKLTLRNVSTAVASSLSLRISPAAEISAVKIGAGAVDFAKNEEKVGSGTLQRIVIRSLSVPVGATIDTEVTYRLRIDENSGLAATTPLRTQLLPMSFWYPTPNSWFFPRGADFAPYRIQVTSPGGLGVLSAGNGVSGAFEQALLGQPFFVAGSYEVVTVRNVSVHLSKGAGADEKKRAEDVANLAADAKAYFETLFGSSPNAPLRIISVRRGAGYSDAGTLLVDENVFRRQKLDSLTAMSVAESVAHVWLGASTSIAGDGGGVVREGLVRFVATEFLESKYGKEIADLERLRQRTAYASVSKRDAPLSQITPLDDYYFVTNANKGSMIWRLLSKKIGADAFFGVLKANMKTGSLDLSGLRAAFGQQKELLDYGFDQLTDLDLLIGLPQAGSAETKMALRNTGSVDAEVDVIALTEKGERLRNIVKIPAKGFSETAFKTLSKIVRVEIDSDKIFPQLDYSNDVKPVEVDESDALLFTKRPFDRQDFPAAERNARIVLRDVPRFDDVRVILARSLLAEGKLSDAEREFRAIVDEKLPTARSLAWANVGLGEIALKTGQQAQAIAFFDIAIRASAEIGASLAARQGRLKANAPAVNDESVKAFFASFDKAAISASKANLETLIMGGETPKAFVGGIAGQAQEWTSRVTQIDVVDPLNVLVEVDLNIRIINKNPESGSAVFRLSRSGSNWKLSGVESFEVR
ncbi:MAG: hypothetical protein IPJ30_03165 [Acidobacteria bacterium]|nr:hypothetical protein [Acidobacteriota bacterium]